MIKRIMTAWKRWRAARRWHYVGYYHGCEIKHGIIHYAEVMLYQNCIGGRKIESCNKTKLLTPSLEAWLNGGDLPEGTIR